MDALLAEPRHEDLRGQVAIVTPRQVGKPAWLPRFQHVSAGRFGRGYMWEQYDLPQAASGGVLLSLCNLGPVAKRRQVVVIHDAATKATPQSFSRRFRLAYSVLVPALARRACQLATVSAFSRGELARCFGVSETRVAVCYEGAEHILAAPSDPAVLGQHGLTPRRYLLAAGGGGANKNQALLVEAFHAAKLDNVRLVFTGKRNGRVNGAGHVLASDRVGHVGYVSDPQLRALYENALAFVYPSSYEGFGLPPLEAMACGCPVIISSQPALCEIADGAAEVVPVNETRALAAAMRRLSGDPEHRADLIARGRERAGRFTWRATAERLLEQCRAAAT